MKTYDDEVRQALSASSAGGKLRIVEDTGETFALLARAFPMEGSKIDWDRLPVAQGSSAAPGPTFPTSCLMFWARVSQEERLSGLVTYVGDGPTNLAIEAMHEDVAAILRAVLEVPQHHYLVGVGGSWCICFSMEGDLDFGRSPSYSGLN